MFHSQTFKSVRSVNLRECHDIDKYITKELQKIEGSCIDAGFVKKGSVKLITRSIGTTHSINSNGDIYYDVVFSADIFNPRCGEVVPCVVEKVNKLGILAHGDKELPICVIIARQHHNESFRDCTEKEKIECEVIGSRFNMYDREIQVIGKII